MTDYYNSIAKRTRGAWAVHHAQKTAATVNGSAEFSALDTAGKAASLLSQLAASDQITVEKARVDALAKAAGLNVRLEVPALLDLLSARRLIQRSTGGDIELLGLTSSATVSHAADLFEDLEPTPEEKATIAIAELTSASPQPASQVSEFIGDEFKLAKSARDNLMERSEIFGFVDAEVIGPHRVVRLDC